MIHPDTGINSDLNSDILYHETQLEVYRAAQIGELIILKECGLYSNKDDVRYPGHFSITDINDSKKTAIIEYTNSSYDGDSCLIVNKAIKTMVAGKWTKGQERHRLFITSEETRSFQGWEFKFRISKWAEGECKLVYETHTEEYDLENDDGYEIHNKNGKDIIVKKWESIKKIECPDGYSLTNDFFKGGNNDDKRDGSKSKEVLDKQS